MSKRVIIPAILFVLLFVELRGQGLFVNPHSSFIAKTGRIDTTSPDAYRLYWPGTSLKINFEGTEIKALLKDQYAENYYTIIVDKDSILTINLDTVKHFYTLVEGLPQGEHSIELFKRTGWMMGWSDFYGFKLNDEAKLLPPPPDQKRRIEFFGNSITVGISNMPGADDGTGEEDPYHGHTNNYYSYAAITARHFDAAYHNTSRSGIGITISWSQWIMQDIYNRLDPKNPESKWDFSLFTPQVVVINLFQNDSWLVNNPDYPEFKKRFGKKAPSKKEIIAAYKKFLVSLRKEYPDAAIICTLGSMDATEKGSPWPGYISKAVKQTNDDKIFTLFFPCKETRGHPSIEEHRKMAAQLIAFIEENIKW